MTAGAQSTPSGAYRDRRRSSLVALAALSLNLAWTRYAASLGPLDLAASREGSTLVVDRNGRLLRPFTMPDGRWRLPATTQTSIRATSRC